MIHSVRFTCVLDTNVIHPLEIRDLLFWFAHYNLYTIKWSRHIFDFPPEYLSTFGLSAMSADDFLADTIDLNQETVLEAFRELVMNRRNPDMDEFAVLESMRRNGLIDTANYLHALL